MKFNKNISRKIASLLFLTSTLLTTTILNQLNFSNILALTGGLFTASITAGIWLETSYRFLVKEATAPLDKLIEKL